MVTAELREEPFSDQTLLLIIRNYGPSVARNVVVTFDPPLPDPSSERAANSLAPFLKARYATLIPVLIPGMELDNIYFTGQPGNDGSGLQNYEELPDQVTVMISYDARDGAQYEDKYPLDVDVLRNRTYVSSSTRHPSERLKAIERALNGINGTIRAIARRLPAQNLSRSSRQPPCHPGETETN